MYNNIVAEYLKYFVEKSLSDEIMVFFIAQAGTTKAGTLYTAIDHITIYMHVSTAHMNEVRDYISRNGFLIDVDNEIYDGVYELKFVILKHRWESVE